MTAQHRPAIDEGDPPGALSTLRDLLEPRPGRLHNTLLMTVQVLVVVTIWEVFRIPEPAIAAYIVLFASAGDAVSTGKTAIGLIIAATLAMLTCIAVMMLSLSQPALRLPLMASATFAAMLAVRASPLGPLAFGFGFLLVYGLTTADEIDGIALQPGGISNVAGAGLPQLATIPPEESLLRLLLWLILVVLVPSLLLVLVNQIAGRDPERLLRRTMVERLGAAASFCRGEPGAGSRLEALARAGAAEPLKLLSLAEKRHGTQYRHEANTTLLRALNRLVLLLAAWRSVDPEAARPGVLSGLGDRCDAIAREIEQDRPHQPAVTQPALSLPPDAPAILLPLSLDLQRTLDTVTAADRTRSEARPSPHGKSDGSKGLFTPGAINTANVQFALKVTLAVMTVYVIENALDWLAIDTCVVTCFFVALGSLGESVHKMTLRIAGCLIGGTLGIGSILLLMPVMTGLPEFLLLIAAVTLAGAWISTGSPRIAYAGWQLAFAFYVTVLQGYGPTLDMQTARDRVIGILLGNVVCYLVFAHVWPVRVADQVRPNLVRALSTLAELMALRPGPSAGAIAAAEAGLRERFFTAANAAGALLVNDRYEPPAGRRSPIDRALVGRIQALIVPVSLIVIDAGDAGPAQDWPQEVRRGLDAHRTAMQRWFDRAAGLVATGANADTLKRDLPEPPDFTKQRALLPEAEARRLKGHEALHRLLASELHTILDTLLPPAVPARASQRSRQDLALAG